MVIKMDSEKSKEADSDKEGHGGVLNVSTRNSAGPVTHTASTRHNRAGFPGHRASRRVDERERNLHLLLPSSSIALSSVLNYPSH